MFFRKEKSNKKGVLVAALLGALAGSIVALMFAPKKGKELRNDLAKKCKETADKTKDILNDVGEQADSLVDRAKELAKQAKEASNAWFNRN